jgi:DNA repair ATPase RecN
MLTHLQIRDLAIVDTVELDFVPGLTVLTGETGAGKSIIVDALTLISGARAAAEQVRAGAERAEGHFRYPRSQEPRVLPEEQSITPGRAAGPACRLMQLLALLSQRAGCRCSSRDARARC